MMKRMYLLWQRQLRIIGLRKSLQKSKKENIENLCINLVKNPDILMELGKNKKTQFLVGFAAETNNLIENGLKN